MSDIYQVNDEFRRKLLKMERSAASVLLREYGRAWTVIRKEIINLNTQYEGADEVSAAAWLYESGRLAGLKQQTEAEIAKFARYADKAIQEEQKEAVRMARKSAGALLESSLPKGVKVSFNQLPVEAFENLIGFLQNGSPLSRLLNELPGEAGKAVADGLQTGMLLGWNPTRTARSIRETLGGNLARALRIARTETLRSYREASRQIFKANDHVVEGWRWASARNERTCAMCWAMDGTEHTLDEQLEEHICGRCSMVPITRSWRGLGFDIDEAEGLKPATGIAAFGQLSDTEQLRVLGPAKYAAWKEGKFELGDVVGRKYDPQWGWTRYEKSLKDLIGAEEAKGYTRLALMGVAKNAGDYSVDDLIRVAGLGLRELTPAEIQKIREVVAVAGFSSDPEKCGSRIAGLIWEGKVIHSADKLPTGVVHYLRHAVQGNEWPSGTTIEEYYANLNSVVMDKESQIIISDLHNFRQIGFFSSEGIWVDYRIKYGKWVTGMYLDDINKVLTDPRRKNIKWLK